MRTPVIVRLLFAGWLALVTVMPAFADPTNNPKVFTVPLTCGNQSLTVTTLDNASGTGWVVDGTGVTVATRVVITSTFTNPATGQAITVTETSTFGPGHGHARGLQDKLMTCTATVAFEDPDVGTVSADFEVTLFATPRR